MGYYTTHELEIIKGDNLIDICKEEISKLADYSDCFDESIKCYEHEENMREYSLLHPDTLFKLSGIGEENGDLWHEYYLNGKMQRVNAVITFEEFDESKLK